MSFPLPSVEAAGPDCYKQFMAVLCGYIVEKQQEVQGEDLPFDLVFVSYVYEKDFCTSIRVLLYVYASYEYIMLTYTK